MSTRCQFATLAVWNAVVLGVVLQLRHLGEQEVHELHPVLHAARDISLSLPLIFVAVVVGSIFANRLIRLARLERTTLARLTQALSVAVTIAVAFVPGALGHGALFTAEGAALDHALREALAVLPFALAATLLTPSRFRPPADGGAFEFRSTLASWSSRAVRVVGQPGQPRRRRARPAAAIVAVLTAVVVLLPLATNVGLTGSVGAAGPTTALACNAGSVNRAYAVSAINVVIPRNRWGDVDLHGQIYALDQDKEAIRHWAFPLDDPSAPTSDRRVRPRPLVLRANEGECVSVTLTNELAIQAPVPTGSPPAYGSVGVPGDGLPLNQFVSIQANGVSYNVQTSDGSQVGFNNDTSVAPGATRTYYWRVSADEGAYLFRDQATLAGSEADGGSIGHGLYGVLAVEPSGSQWFDPISGARLDSATPYTAVATQSGELYLDAIIVPPAAVGGSYSIDSLNLPVRAADSVAFRESLQISQDEMPGVHLQNCDLEAADLGIMRQGRPDRVNCSDAETDTPNSLTLGIGLGFNYGEEHLLLRAHEINRCPDCVGEETWLSSWPYGDPALVKLAGGLGPWYPTWHPWYDGGLDGAGANSGQQDFDNTDEPEDCGITTGCYTANVPHAYQYDATKIRFIHAGPKETHVFHMHAHQWLTDPQDIGLSGSTPGVPDDNRLPEGTTIDSQTFGPGEGFTADLLFGAGSRPGTVGDSIFHCHLYPHFAEGFWSLFRTHDVLEDGSGLTPDGLRVRTIQPLPDRADSPHAPNAADPGYPRFIPGQIGWRAPQPLNGVSENNGLIDNPVTVVREDLDPATRLVAGVALTQPVQELTVSDATGGTFTLTFGAATTAPIAWNAPGSTVESALETLPGIVGASVNGAGSAADPYVVQFEVLVHDVAAAASILLTADGTDLSPAGASIAVAATWADGGAQEQAATNVAYQLSLETAATLESHNDGIFDDGSGNNVPLPGSPLVDPCLPGSREVTYNVSMIQLDVVYNDADWHDTQARILVLDEHVEGVLNGTKPVEPFFFRVNPNDCVNFNLTNRLPNWLGNDDFLELIQTNMVGEHIHLVKFDVTASDGASNGWNYQQAAYSEAQATFDDSVLNGTPLPIGPDFTGLPDGAVADCGADVFGGASAADLSSDGCRIPFPADFDPEWTCASVGGCPVGQTIHERWYVDYDLRTIFTHDHHFPAEDQNRGLFGAMVVEPAGMDVRDTQSGQFMQPINNAGNGPVCGTACNGSAVGTRVDIIGPAPDDDFREFALGIQDFVSLYRPCTVDCDSSLIPGQEPLAPPGEPEIFPADDPGVMGINYRNEPFVIRDSVGGVPTDPAYVFSSTVHGDPSTPLLQAYANDPVTFRVIQGSQEEQHVLQLHGLRWRDEPDDPESPLVNARALGISEAFNFVAPAPVCGLSACFGDYLYGGTSTDDMWAGAWGILRVFQASGSGTTLLPLPDNVPPLAIASVDVTVTGQTPVMAADATTVCPTGAPLRSYHVIALDAAIVYDAGPGIHDPFGLVYAAVNPGETPAEAAARVRASNPDPMVLRAIEGDCIEVTLTNMIDPAGDFATLHAPVGAQQSGSGFDPPLVLESESGTPAGLRVSLHAALVDYDPQGSDGATVGFNPDQTVGPRALAAPVGSEGQSILYRWYAPAVTPGELGAINLTDYGDVRGHRHHGLFAGLVIEPAGATWTDPVTGEPGTTSAQADIRVGGGNDFREFVTFYQDGLNLWDSLGNALPDPFDHPPADGEPGEFPDPEDRGEKGLNYRNEAFQQRLGLPPGTPLSDLNGTDLAHIFSSTIHGDPDTPIFRAYAGDDVRWRVLQGADKPRQHTFSISGHSWFVQPNETDGEVSTIGAQGGLSVGRSLDIETAAGGTTSQIGDYRYGDVVLDNKLSGGWWGVLRVYDPAGATSPPASAFANPDNPHTPGYAPILPLNAAPAPPAEPVFFSLLANSTLPDVGFVRDEDIVSFDPLTGVFAMVFDGSDVGVGPGDIDGFAFLDSDTILMSFNVALTVPGVGVVDDSDIVRFDATALGASTAGTFSTFFDGSLVGLDLNGEDVDAVELLPDGTLLVSIVGSGAVTGVATVRDEDLLRFTPTLAGDYTAGTWTVYFDGGDVGLTVGAEDVNGAFVDGPDLFLSTIGDFTVTGLTGADEDIWSCNDHAPGPATSCSGFSTLVDGDAIGIPATADIDGIDLLGDPAPPAPPTISIGDVTLAEGDGGTTSFGFEVTLSHDPALAVMVQVDTADDSAEAGSDYTAVAGLVLNFAPGGSLTQTVDVDVSGDTDPELDETFFVNLSAEVNATIADGQGVGTILDDDVVAPPPPGLVFFSTLQNTTLPDVGFVRDEDIVSFDPATGVFAMVFDGSDVGVNLGDVDGFAFLDSDTIAMSFATPLTIPGIGVLVDDSDIVLFDAAGGSLGATTSGAFSILFDGSLVDLDLDSEDVDAVELLTDGSLLISIVGSGTVTGVATVRDEDLLLFTPTVPGVYNAGTWTVYFDGGDVGLTVSAEDVNGAFVVGSHLHLTTLGDFAVAGLAGSDEDIFACNDHVVGGGTSCSGLSMFLDGSVVLIPVADDLDGIDFVATGP